jgi:hypothetical protein
MNTLMARTAEDAAHVGEAFVEAMGRRDFVRLEALFDPRVRFRALVPPGLRAAEDATAAVAHLRRWFGDADRFDLVASTVDRVGPRLRVTYRIRLREAGLWYTVEQQAYVDVEDDRIRSVHLLCSGFDPESEGSARPGP